MKKNEYPPLAPDKVFKIPVLSTKEWCQKHGTSNAGALYAIKHGLIDYIMPAGEYLIVLTDKTLQYVPNERKKAILRT